MLIVYFSIFFPILSFSQNFQKEANEAFLLTRMVNKFHVNPRLVNDSFSALVFKEFLEQADTRKMFLTKEDVVILSSYKTKLDDEILNKQFTFLQLATRLFEQRVLMTDTIIDNIAKSPFNFNLAEKITKSEFNNPPANDVAMRMGFYKWMKKSTLNFILNNNEDIGSLNAPQLKKYTDSIEPIGRLKAKSICKRYIKGILERPGGIAQEISDSYCKAIAHCFDPHTAYLPLTDKENFESDLGNKKILFGFSLDKNENGEPEIDNLLPGSSAFKCGQFNKGDKIVSLQWEGKSAIDVSDASIQEIYKILDASNHDKMVFTILKPDGTTKQVPLIKEKSDDVDDEDNKVKSFILKGNKTIGYISLPSFYEDWEDEEINRNGCANDVAKEIVKLKNEKIDGLILDVRYNGGGSAREAAELAGIFIDGGPVAQFKSKEAKAFTLKDINRGTIYDGPLVVMVNGYSASASELIAGTLQDYNRAIIVGSTTYGKATAQAVFPMDTTIKIEEDFSKIQTNSYVKITTSQLFRITGRTAQGIGVMPDVIFPDMLQVDGQREENNPLSIRATTVDANKYYTPYASLPLEKIKATGNVEVASSDYFQKLLTYIVKRKTSLDFKDVSLRISDYTKLQVEKSMEEPTADSVKADYIVTQHNFEKARQASNIDLKEMNESWMELLLEDPYIRATYKVMLTLIK